MMRFDPTIVVRRMVIMRDGYIAYDEEYHRGVNIIRGENSSGKSTILNFIFYGLGGDLTDWSDKALLCTHVMIEASLSGKVSTLRRLVSKERGQALEFFGGTIDEARVAPVESWIRYTYSRSASKESFSQALFRLLGFPDVANEQSGNLTMHQILRLLYADQLSPVESLFKHESNFDSPIIRDAIGRLLCGALNPDYYTNEIRLRELNKNFDAKSAELRSLLTVASRSGEPLTEKWIDGQRHVLIEKRNSVQREIEDLEKRIYQNPESDELSLNAQKAAYARYVEAQNLVEGLRHDLNSLELTISDSDLFIANLDRKISALQDSAAVAAHVGEVRFGTCPSCFAALGDTAPDHACHLCKTPFDAERSKGRIAALINDTAIQLKQSRHLQDRRKEKRRDLENAYAEAQAKWRTASNELAATRRVPSTEAQEKLRNAHRNAGYIDRDMEMLDSQSNLVKQISALSAEKEAINSEINRLRGINERLRLEQSNNLSRAYASISDKIKYLLSHDLRRQDSFENPELVEFDFGANRISVDGNTYFSASSRVILKSSFFVGFIEAAMENPFFRHPRFCIIDTIEDKGMEVTRSHNFQNLIADASAKSKVEHQIIFATAMISPDLDDEEHVVGRYYTRDEPTLNIQ